MAGGDFGETMPKAAPAVEANQFFNRIQAHKEKLQRSGILVRSFIDRLVNGIEDQAGASTMSEIMTLKILRGDADAILSYLGKLKELKAKLGTQFDVEFTEETLRVRILYEATNGQPSCSWQI